MFTLVDPKSVLTKKAQGATNSNVVYFNGIGNILDRDKTQSRRLHEPEHRMNTIDPMNGNDIDNVLAHPSIKDGNITMYFESEDTKQAYIKMPINHPNRILPFPVSENDDRGG
jgi:YHS domain-containing protein